MSVFISDKDTAKLYVQFFWTKLTPNLNISATDNELIYIRDFEAVQKTRSRVFSCMCIVRFKNPRRRRDFLNLIIHLYSFFKQYFNIVDGWPCTTWLPDPDDEFRLSKCQSLSPIPLLRTTKPAWQFYLSYTVVRWVSILVMPLRLNSILSWITNNILFLYRKENASMQGHFDNCKHQINLTALCWTDISLTTYKYLLRPVNGTLMNVNKVQAGETQNTNACEIRHSVIQH